MAPILAGAGKGEAFLIISTAQGVTSAAAGWRTTRTSCTKPCASISVSMIATPYSSGGILPLWICFA